MSKHQIIQDNENKISGDRLSPLLPSKKEDAYRYFKFDYSKLNPNPGQLTQPKPNTNQTSIFENSLIFKENSKFTINSDVFDNFDFSASSSDFFIDRIYKNKSNRIGIRIAQSIPNETPEDDVVVLDLTEIQFDVENPIHIAIHAEKHSKGTLIIKWAENRPESELIKSGLLNLILQNGANLKIQSVQCLSAKTDAFIRTQAHLENNAVLELNLFQFGGHKTQNRVIANLAGHHSLLSIEALQVANQNQTIDLNLEANHLSPDTKSTMICTNIVDDHAETVFNGLINITEKATRSSAHQTNKNILLNEYASAYALPKLEIDTDEVECSHGSSTSTLDPEQIYYLNTRGVPEKEARQMLIDGHAFPLIDKIKHQNTKLFLQDYFANKTGLSNG